MVRPDGTFVIRATLRSFFSDDGDLTLAARGRYAVASVEGGNATVYGIAGQDTHVVLSQPSFVLQRKTGGKLLHFSVRIPGADDHVRVAIKIGAKTLATGYSTNSRHVLEDHPEARGARQPPRRRIGARRRHGDLERHAAQPLATAEPPVPAGPSSSEGGPVLLHPHKLGPGPARAGPGPHLRAARCAGRR